MADHIRSDRLHDYVEDLLCREERAEVEQHLVACDACARQAGALRNQRVAEQKRRGEPGPATPFDRPGA